MSNKDQKSHNSIPSKSAEATPSNAPALTSSQLHAMITTQAGMQNNANCPVAAGHCRAIGEVNPLVVTTRLDDLINWCRGNSIWYLLFATACCGIELMQAGGPRTDLDRFGAVFRGSPRQSDLLIVAGTITYKMADRVRLLYSRLAEPKYVIAMGSCANTGGLFQSSYSVIPGVDTIVPVDIYLPGCPPRPEALNEALLRLQDKMRGEHWFDRIKA
jgi:NADH-quinone oxidoreductase subunit B